MLSLVRAGWRGGCGLNASAKPRWAVRHCCSRWNSLSWSWYHEIIYEEKLFQFASPASAKEDVGLSARVDTEPMRQRHRGSLIYVQVCGPQCTVKPSSVTTFMSSEST